MFEADRQSALSRTPGALGPDLAAMLRLLRDAPPGAAESTLALVPDGWRTRLAANGIVDARSARGAESLDIKITAYGWNVISSA